MEPLRTFGTCSVGRAARPAATARAPGSSKPSAGRPLESPRGLQHLIVVERGAPQVSTFATRGREPSRFAPFFLEAPPPAVQSHATTLAPGRSRTGAGLEDARTRVTHGACVALPRLEIRATVFVRQFLKTHFCRTE